MTSTVQVIALAIASLHPGFEPRQNHARAETIVETAAAAGVPPLLVVAMVERESRWQAGVFGGRDGQCVGLLQICLHERAACQGPERFDAPACADERLRLQDGGTNLRAAGSLLRQWRKLCRRVTGRPAGLAELLSGYGGFDRPGVTCGRRKARGRWVSVVVPEAIRKTLALYKELKNERKNERKKGSR